MGARASNLDRLHELLAGEAAGDLEAAEREELEALLRQAAPANREEFLEVTALVQLGFLHQDARARQHMPSGLESRLLRQAETWRPAAPKKPVADLARARERRAGAPVASPVSRRGGPATWGAISGWAAAAALAIAFIVTGGPRVSPPDALPSPRQALASGRSTLLRDAADAVTVAWKGSQGSAYAGVSGDVVWSDSRQEGYVRIVELAANDSTRAQYQLWIVAPDRDTHPVDGGVFDVSGEGEAIIPIHAKLAVRAPKAFAITLEQPGGVVVSKGPMLAVAASAA
jgi:anti-sigma-K factor RskA